VISENLIWDRPKKNLISKSQLELTIKTIFISETERFFVSDHKAAKALPDRKPLAL